MNTTSKTQVLNQCCSINVSTCMSWQMIQAEDFESWPYSRLGYYYSYVVKNLLSCQKTSFHTHVQVPFHSKEHSGTYYVQGRWQTKPWHQQHTSEWMQKNCAHVGSDWLVRIFCQQVVSMTWYQQHISGWESSKPTSVFTDACLPLEVFVWMWLWHGWLVPSTSMLWKSSGAGYIPGEMWWI